MTGLNESEKSGGDEMPQQLPEQCVAAALCGVGQRFVCIELALILRFFVRLFAVVAFAGVYLVDRWIILQCSVCFSAWHLAP